MSSLSASGRWRRWYSPRITATGPSLLDDTEAVASEAVGAPTLRRPNRRLAVALTVIPGLGQLYNGQPRKALFYVIGTVFTIGPAVVLLITGERIGHSLLESHIGGLF